MDIATPISNGLKYLKKYLWLKIKQAWLWIKLWFSPKPVSINYFETVQQDAINNVPIYLCWDAENYYKVTINDLDVTFDKNPLVTAEKYNKKFVLNVYGYKSKLSKELIIKVRHYEKTKKIKIPKPIFSIKPSINFINLEKQFSQLPRPRILTKLSPIKILITKFQFSSLKTPKINIKDTSIKLIQSKLQLTQLKTVDVINNNFIDLLNLNSKYLNKDYREEFDKENYKKLNNIKKQKEKQWKT